MQTQSPVALTLAILLVVAVVLLAMASRRGASRRGAEGDGAAMVWSGDGGGQCSPADGGCGDGGGGD